MTKIIDAQNRNFGWEAMRFCPYGVNKAGKPKWRLEGTVFWSTTIVKISMWQDIIRFQTESGREYIIVHCPQAAMDQAGMVMASVQPARIPIETFWF